MKGIAALNVYKKVALVRRSTDTLTFADEEGVFQTVSDLGEAASTSNPSLAPKPKLEIPTPQIIEVEDYDKNVPATYQAPTSYVRYRRSSLDELSLELEYVIDAEDEVWLLNNSKFGGSVAKTSRTPSPDATEQQRKAAAAPKPQLPLNYLERMMDIMEKATAFETIITIDEAERRILHILPDLLYRFPTKARAGITTLKHVLQDVYAYWVQKRSKLKRPLLRRFWPVTASDDTNPHLVFRPREKEKYKLRKKRSNDMEAFRKMKQLRLDFEKVRVLLELVKQREELNRFLRLAQKNRFEQQIYDMVDTSGLPRVSTILRRDDVEEILEMPRHFDTVSGQMYSSGSKKRRRLEQEAAAAGTNSPANADRTGSGGASSSSSVANSNNGNNANSNAAANRKARPLVVAGSNFGEPAPNFLHPLPTRESYVSSWHNAVPAIASYENSHPTPTFYFRHRPRVGRGGRLVIDRLPRQIPANSQPLQTVFVAGHALPKKPKGRLLQLLPPPLPKPHQVMSRKVEELCAAAIRQDYEAMGDHEDNDGDEVIVKVKDWLATDDQLWGDERFAIGPI